jgi:predicted regulator of amino acid metabolism with ACT domain
MAEVNKSQAIRDYFRVNPKAMNQEVVEAMAKKGITVNTNFVSAIKAKHNKVHAARKAAISQAITMDKTPGVNKTQAVRDYFKANKNATNSEVVAALAKQGITITANYVGNIKATHNKRRRVVKRAVAKGGIGIPEIKAALTFIKAAGSIVAAKEALEVAQEIREIV